jgi:flagellar hook-basal body complex protein FliE
MNHAYNKWDELGLVSRYNDVASTVQTMNLMAGIPPGTLPSSATNSEIAVLYREIMSVLSKLGLLCDLTSIKRRPSAASVASSTNTIEKRSTVSINSEMFLEMSIKIVEDCEKFIDLYKSLLRSEHQQLTGSGDTDAESAEDKIQQPEGIYPVKNYKDGIWTDINVTNNGQVTNQSSSVSVTPSAVSGFGITTPSTTRSSSLFMLESFESTEPLNQETVSKLRERQSGLAEAVDRLMKLIGSSEKQKWTLQTIQDRKRIVSTALHNVYNILSSIFYLVETMDLSIYYGGQRRLMLHRSSRSSPGTEAFSCLSLIYEFLDAKQSLYAGLVDVMKAQKQTDSSNGDFITTLSQQLDHDKVVDVYLAYEKSVEDGIREKVGKLGDVMEQVVKISSGLSEEQASFAARPITSSYAAGMMGHRNSSAGIASSENTSGELRSPVKIRNDSGATNTEVTSASSSFKDDDVPWYLQLEYGDEMIYDRKGSPRGGSIRALVEQLTHHDKLRPDFNTAMLLTFRSFTDARELFDLLVDRFSIQPPEGLTPEEFQTWTDKKQKPIRIRVINILKTWLENYWLEDDVDEGSINSTTGSSFMSTTSYAPSVSSTSSRNLLLDSMNKFAVQLNNRKFPGASTLLNLIDQRTRNKEPSFKRIKSNPSPKPPPVLPKSLKKIHLLDIDPTEMARQLTLREFKLYVVITAQECLNRGCGNRGSKSSSGSTGGNQNKIGEFIHNSNQLTNWVSYMILKHSEPKKRAATIKFFVEVSDFCRDMNNFSSMTAIISGLYSSTIHRMKKTWELVPTKTRAKLDNMNQLMNSTRNFNDYRDMLSSICPPAVPFFGVYLTDLTFTEDGNPDHLQNDSRIINFAKRMKAASTIESIRQFQQMPYNFEEIPEIQSFLKHGFDTAPPIEEQYNTSLNMEPRGKPGQDKVAKLLEENGIL